VRPARRCRTEWDWEQRPANTLLLRQYAEHVRVLPSCYLFGQPVNLLDQVLVAHVCQLLPPKVHEKQYYFGFWDAQLGLESLGSAAGA
jgi:hypothetical protein